MSEREPSVLPDIDQLTFKFFFIMLGKPVDEHVHSWYTRDFQHKYYAAPFRTNGFPENWGSIASGRLQQDYFSEWDIMRYDMSLEPNSTTTSATVYQIRKPSGPYSSPTLKVTQHEVPKVLNDDIDAEQTGLNIVEDSNVQEEFGLSDPTIDDYYDLQHAFETLWLTDEYMEQVSRKAEKNGVQETLW